MPSYSVFTNPLSCLCFHVSKSEFEEIELLFKNPLWPKWSKKKKKKKNDLPNDLKQQNALEKTIYN